MFPEASGIIASSINSGLIEMQNTISESCGEEVALHQVIYRKQTECVQKWPGPYIAPKDALPSVLLLLVSPYIHQFHNF